MAGARVPDLGSDFAQRLLQDLRRRRERLGFASGSGSSQKQQQQQRASSSPVAAASRDACSNSLNSVRTQKPRQAAAQRTQPQHPSNAVAGAGKPRQGRRDFAAADARAIVPFQAGGAGGGHSAVIAGNVNVQMAALALALSEGGKLRNTDMVARNGAVFFRHPDAARQGGGYLHAGEVAIGVQDLNDMLMDAYNSGGRRRRPDDEESRNRLFRGSMDMEEALSMLLMLQDASGCMEGSGGGNALLLKGQESRESSARIEEIVDEEDSDAAEHARNTSMQMVVHSEFQSHQSSSKISNASVGEKDGSKVRMPSVIAKLMGLENLPPSSSTTTTKSVAERKGTERFVRPGAVPRMEARGGAMDRKLPIRIVASEKGQHKIVLAEEWKNGLTKFGDSEIGAPALSNSSSSHPATGNSNRKGRLTMREVLRSMVAAERGADGSQGSHERIIHEDKRIVEEIKMQSSVSVGCRAADSGKKMDFLKRFRKNPDNMPVKEEKQTAQVKNAASGKKQATGMRRLLGRDGEAKSRRAREKLNKENLAIAQQTKAAGKHGKADQIKCQAQSKLIDTQSKPRKPQNCRATRSETPSRKLENKKRLLMPEAGNVKKKPECNVVTKQGNEEHVEMNDTISCIKPADCAGGVGGLSETLARVVRGSSAAETASLDQPLEIITEGTSDPTIFAETVVVQANEDLNLLDQSAVAEIDDETINHTPNETTQIPETFGEKEEEEEEQQQEMTVKDQLTDGPDQTATSNNPTASPDHKAHVVSCDSLTENQLLLMRLLVKDRYLLETAKAIVRVDAPVSFIDDDDGGGARSWSDKGNDLLSDVAREVVRRKGKRSEAVEQVSIARAANPKLRYLDDLVRELDGDVESLGVCSGKPHRQQGGDNGGAAEGLQMVLRSDITNGHPDANSTWDFGWNGVGDLPIEKGEVVRDLEKNILGGIITDVARDLIGASVRHGSCPCVA